MSVDGGGAEVVDQDQSDAIDLVQLALRVISEFPNFA